MGNNKTKLNLDSAFPNILSYQKKEILKNFSKGELQLLFRLFLNLKSRSIEDGIDKVTFHHFCQLPGIWGQRFWTKFQRGSNREYIEFDEFVYSLYLCCRAPVEEQDKFYFDLFHLGQKNEVGKSPTKKEITKEEILCMMYNMPTNGILCTNKDHRDGGQKSKEGQESSVEQWHGFHIEKSANLNNPERLRIGDKKYFHVLPDQIRTIVDKMLMDITDNDKLTMTQFKKFLERNPDLRKIIQESLKPQLWTINEKNNPYNYDPQASSQQTPETTFESRSQTLKIPSSENGSKTSIQGDQPRNHSRSNSMSCFGGKSTKADKNSIDSGEMEGELMKVGKKYDVFVNRYYQLRDSSLISYKDKSSKIPTDVIYLHGLYIEPYFYKGVKGFKASHDSDYFKEKMYFSKDNQMIDRWIGSVKNQAKCHDVTKKYERLNQLGKGKFSTVYLCRSQETDECVAMKLIDKKQLTTREREFLREEIQIIRSISHPNVVEMKDAFENLQNMYIMMECIQGGELFDHIKDYEISEKEAALITHQILEALQYLHLCGIVHRDLKPENILVEFDEVTQEVQHVKITDFGLSKIIMPGELMGDSCGTPAYVAPEVLSKKGYYKEVDIWSAGVILYTMLARALPFHSSDRKKTFKLIKEADPDLSGEAWQPVSPECKDVLQKMLIKDPKERISVDDALKHPWFKKYEQHLKEVKEKYHPVIDSTGALKRPLRSASLLDASSQLSRLAVMQQSMTDYAEVVGEGDARVKVPAAFKTKNLEERQHHLEKIENDSDESVDEDLKDVKMKEDNARKGRLEEIFGASKAKPKAGGLLHHDPSRTLQPIKGFDLGLLQEQEKKQNEMNEKQKKKSNLVILKTHRFFSDLHDDDHHEDL